MLPHELVILRARLESEDIECFVNDEYTVQVYNFYSQAVGGVKLQVYSRDVERALPILTDMGYYKEEETQHPLFFRKIAAVMHTIQLKNDLWLKMRKAAGIVFKIGIICLALYLIYSLF